MRLAIDFDCASAVFDERGALSNLSLHLDGGKIRGRLVRTGSRKRTMRSLPAAFIDRRLQIVQSLGGGQRAVDLVSDIRPHESKYARVFPSNLPPDMPEFQAPHRRRPHYS